MNTLGGELLSHLATVLLLTLVLAPLLLGRYRRAVLGGMMMRPGPTLAVATPLQPAAATPAATAAPAGPGSGACSGACSSRCGSAPSSRPCPCRRCTCT